MFTLRSTPPVQQKLIQFGMFVFQTVLLLCISTTFCRLDITFARLVIMCLLFLHIWCTRVLQRSVSVESLSPSSGDVWDVTAL